jgi:biopolymer transport protein ExbD
MADINNANDGKKRKGRVSNRLDMTPMVDLGFLLITFFVLTTSFMKPNSIDLTIPAKNNCSEPPTVSKTRVLQVFLGENDKLYYYNPLLCDDPQVVDFQSSNNVREVFKTARLAIKEKWGKADTMLVLVKPSNKSKYKNMVDVLDEITLSQIKYYTFVDYKLPEDSVFLLKAKNNCR